MEKDQPFFIFKLCLLGAGAVGKTCICRRLCYDTFDTNTKLTIGIDFYTYRQPIILDGKEGFLTLSIWDFGGQEQFRTMFNYYINGANGIFLVFSLIDKNTFTALDWWTKQLKRFDEKNTPKILIGAKSDLVRPEDENKIDNLIINQFMKRQNLDQYYKTSSKENVNIKKIFKIMTKIMLDEHMLKYDKII